jgi:hypothetical protein
MFAAAAGASHPAVAALLGLGAAALASAVVAMAWNVNARQIRLAEQLARRQFIVTGGAGTAGAEGSAANGNGHAAALKEAAAGGAGPALVVIDGPETVVTGEQARYRVRAPGGRQVVSWAAGGGSVTQTPDPAHPDELLLIAGQPGSLMVSARVREGMTEHRATKPVTAVADVTAPASPFPLRLFLHGWGLVVVAILIVGFAGALAALGSFTPADFIALAALLAALLGVTAVARGTGDPPSHPGSGPPRP